MHLDSPTDYRLQTLQENGTYFMPLGEASRAQADQLFEQLTVGLQSSREELHVKGRMIAAEHCAGGVARFSFAQLCEQPHGAEDYLTIAQHYHTVFLDCIPKLGYDRRNEAKRFMTLIDALYEHRVKVIFTADAPPGELYRGRDHGFEFERTVSRLIEMQSASYLHDKKTKEKDR